MAQKDFKKLIAYSSISHMGVVILGMTAMNTQGMMGAVFQMFSHGIVASLLFAVVGRMVYDRTHTRELEELGAMQLARKMPFVAGTFILAGLASMGLPGFSGFVAELMVLLGAWQRFPWLVLLTGVGILMTVAYTFRAIHKAFYGDQPFSLSVLFEPIIVRDPHALPPITWQEKVASMILLVLLVIVGLYPSLLLNMIHHSVELMLPALLKS